MSCRIPVSPAVGDHGFERGIAQRLVEGVFNAGGMADSPENAVDCPRLNPKPGGHISLGNPLELKLVDDPKPFLGLDADPDSFSLAF